MQQPKAPPTTRLIAGLASGWADGLPNCPRAIVALGLGALWGAMAWLVADGVDWRQIVALAVLSHAACVANMAWLARWPGVYAVLTLLALSPVIVRAALLPTSQGPALSAALMASLVVHGLLAWRPLRARAQRQSARDGLLREHPKLLAARLAADSERQKAEAANQAKTRFLAAASHDLRQPLHALSLFANALRDRSHEPDRQRLVDNIAEAVSTLEDLFTELLDISRIDSGAIEVRPSDFSVEMVWRRLRLHFEPVAFDKGLAFTQRGGHHVVHADPVLVERIVRNLTANAVRYTEDGGVLLAARRRGDRVLLQVWDSGVGIAPADQARVFDEFVQVGPARRAGEPGRQRGLGLGLAIVRRLTDLMDAPLELISIPGHGTRLTLSLPLGQGAMAAPVPARPPAMLGPTLDQRRIVVVERDAACRAELHGLLSGWGAEVEDFDDAAACELRCRAQPGSTQWPDLLVVGSPQGIDDPTEAATLARLHGLFGAAIPVLHVGGAPAPPPHDGAAVRDPERLGKPLQPNRLRAMVVHKVGSGSVSAPSALNSKD
jgi:signal transduction histidine kinase